MKNLAIILAGGSGSRLKNETPKQFLKLAGKLIIEHTIEKFEKHPDIATIFIVTNPLYYDKTIEIIEKNSYKKVKRILKGGSTRQESSYIGISSASDEYDNVLIHDAVRPFLSSEIIDKITDKLYKYDAIDVAIPSPDTIIRIDDKNLIKEIPERKYLRRGQTPQAFKLSLIKKAHNLALKEGFLNATDDCSLVLKYGLSEIFVVNGSDFNIKITYPIDIHIADKIFQIKNERIKKIDNKSLRKFFKDKVIIIFGGNSGIGKSIFDTLKKIKAKPYSLSSSNGTDIRDYSNCEKSLKNIYEKEGRIDGVIITAARLKFGFIETMDLKDLKEQIETNLLGNIYAAKASIPYLKESKGSIIFFASSSYTRGRSGYSPYSASKAGIINFAQALADELIEYNIKVNIVNPERASTPMRFNAFGKEDDSTLLSPEFIALHTLNIMTKEITGSIFDIRVIDEKKGNR